MELAGILRNIEAQLEVLGITADDASKRAGHPDSIRNLRRIVRAKGKGSFKVETLLALATALKTTAEALLREPPPVAQDGDAPRLREFLLAQRALIERQLAQLDAEPAQKPKRRAKNR